MYEQKILIINPQTVLHAYNPAPFLNFVNSQSSVNSAKIIENFIIGFRLGVRIGIEVMNGVYYKIFNNTLSQLYITQTTTNLLSGCLCLNYLALRLKKGLWFSTEFFPKEELSGTISNSFSYDLFYFQFRRNEFYLGTDQFLTDDF